MTLAVEVVQLGEVLVGTVAVSLYLRQLRLDPLELLVGQVDVSRRRGCRLQLNRDRHEPPDSFQSRFRYSATVASMLARG